MRHQKRKFLKFKNKDQSQRDSMLRKLVTSIFTHKSLITTEKRARAIIPMVDKLIHAAQGDNKMNAIRTVMQVVYTQESSEELFGTVAPAMIGRSSGFTRITPIKYRDGDRAKLVKIEFVS